MAISKKEREALKMKYGGKCAYCGCELQPGWHVDHFEPCRRNYSTEWDHVKGKHIRRLVGHIHPERNSIENMMPSCASCNINKHGATLEQFRNYISAYMKHLNTISTQYKIAKRYGLVIETNVPVVFYFETFKPK